MDGTPARTRPVRGRSATPHCPGRGWARALEGNCTVGMPSSPVVLWYVHVNAKMRLTLPSTAPELCGRVSPLMTAMRSRCSPAAKECSWGRSSARTCPIQVPRCWPCGVVIISANAVTCHQLDGGIGAPPTFRTADPLGSRPERTEISGGKYRTYSPEFKEEAVRLVIDTSRPIGDVARELQITETSLGNWVRAYREKHAEEEPPLQVSERARLRELERRNRELEMELAFLKKAAAYFAREHR